MASYDNVSTVMPTVTASNPTKAPEEGGLVFVVLSCLCASLWAIYITFYHSRLMGIILTRLIRLKYIEDGQYFKIGKFAKIPGAMHLLKLKAHFQLTGFSTVFFCYGDLRCLS